MTKSSSFYYTTAIPGFDYDFPLPENEHSVSIYIGAGDTRLELSLPKHKEPLTGQFHFLLNPDTEVPPYFKYTGYSFDSTHHQELRINNTVYLYLDDAARSLYVDLLYTNNQQHPEKPEIRLALYRDNLNPENFLFHLVSSCSIPVTKEKNSDKKTNYILLHTIAELTRGITPIDQPEWTDEPLQLFVNARDTLFGSPKHIQYARNELGKAEQYRYAQNQKKKGY